MFNFFKKKKEEKTYPSLHIELLNDQTINVQVSWPDPRTPEEAVDLAKIYAGFVYLLSSRDILPPVTQALVLYGNKSNTSEVSNMILTLLNKALVKNSDGNPDRPVVKPTEAFKGNNREDDD